MSAGTATRRSSAGEGEPRSARPPPPATERQNPDPRENFVRGRYDNAEETRDAEDGPFRPRGRYYVGGKTKV